MITTADIEKGIAVRHKGEIWVVVEFQHVSPGKGSAFVRTRMKNVKTGKVVEETFKSGEAMDIVEVDRTRMQYLYSDASMHYFMNPATYEQVSMAIADVGDDARYFKEGLEVTLMFHEGIPISIEMPRKIIYTIKNAPPGVKGDTASGRVTKEAVVDNDLKVQVPLFINEGDQIIVNTETGEYVERAQK